MWAYKATVSSGDDCGVLIMTVWYTRDDVLIMTELYWVRPMDVVYVLCDMDWGDSMKWL